MNLLIAYVISIEFQIQFNLSCLGAVTLGRRLILHRYVGTGGKPSTWFPPGTRRAKQRSEEQCLLQTGRCCNLAADLPDQLAGHRFAAFCRPCCRLSSLAARSLSVFLSGSPGWLAASLARWRWLALAGADCRNNCWLLLADTG